MRVLGVDVPGKHLGGYAVWDTKKQKVLRLGSINWQKIPSEKEQLQHLNLLFHTLFVKYKFEVIAVEHPFLHEIAQWIGSVKMWVAINHRHPGWLHWYMLSTSHARKLVFGDAKRITRINKNGREVSIHKEVILERMSRFVGWQLTQHEADALLYAIAAGKAMTGGEE